MVVPAQGGFAVDVPVSPARHQDEGQRDRPGKRRRDGYCGGSSWEQVGAPAARWAR